MSKKEKNVNLYWVKIDTSLLNIQEEKKSANN